MATASMPAAESADIEQATVHPPAKSRNERLSLPFGFRLILGVTAASLSGFALGAAQGGTMAGLRFRAENAHRLPTSQVGWYLYHKSKNYNAMLGGVKEGFRMAGRLAIWPALFLYTEEAIDRFRGSIVRQWVGFQDRRAEAKGLEKRERYGLERLENTRGVWVQRDFLSTTAAALSTAGAFSVWNRMPLTTFARTARMGLKAGLAFGLLQDALSLLRGRNVGYVDFMKRKIFGAKREGER